jgi:hypothetical protein
VILMVKDLVTLAARVFHHPVLPVFFSRRDPPVPTDYGDRSGRSGGSKGRKEKKKIGFD